MLSRVSSGKWVSVYQHDLAVLWCHVRKVPWLLPRNRRRRQGGSKRYSQRSSPLLVASCSKLLQYFLRITTQSFQCVTVFQNWCSCVRLRSRSAKTYVFCQESLGCHGQHNAACGLRWCHLSLCPNHCSDQTKALACHGDLYSSSLDSPGVSCCSWSGCLSIL